MQETHPSPRVQGAWSRSGCEPPSARPCLRLLLCVCELPPAVWARTARSSASPLGSLHSTCALRLSPTPLLSMLPAPPSHPAPLQTTGPGAQSLRSPVDAVHSSLSTHTPQPILLPVPAHHITSPLPLEEPRASHWPTSASVPIQIQQQPAPVHCGQRPADPLRHLPLGSGRWTELRSGDTSPENNVKLLGHSSWLLLRSRTYSEVQERALLRRPGPWT